MKHVFVAFSTFLWYFDFPFLFSLARIRSFCMKDMLYASPMHNRQPPHISFSCWTQFFFSSPQWYGNLCVCWQKNNNILFRVHKQIVYSSIYSCFSCGCCWFFFMCSVSLKKKRAWTLTVMINLYHFYGLQYRRAANL